MEPAPYAGPDRCTNPRCEGSKLCEEPGCTTLHPNGCSADETLDGWRCTAHDAEYDPPPRRELEAYADAANRAAAWARDWLDVWGQPSALWELVLRFAALVAMRPGEKRRLDEAHTIGLLDREPGAMLWREPSSGAAAYGIMPGAILLGAFGPSSFGRPLPQEELRELEALLRGACERVEALGAEAELFRHAAGLIRGDGLVYRWTTGADMRDAADAPLDAPHPDAVVFSLPGALRQAWAERGGSGQVPLPTLKRLVQLAAPRGFTFRAEPTADACLLMLRIVNGQAKDGASMLELLIAAALAADAEAESEVL